MEELTFLLISLAFFLYIVHLVERDHNARYERMLNERREFGYRIEDPNARTYTKDPDA